MNLMKNKIANSTLILLAFIPMNFCFGQKDNSTCSPVAVYTPAPAKTKKAEASASKQNVNKLNHKKRRKGNWEFYWDETNAVVSSKGKFRNGKQVGTWKYYSQEGKIERIEKNRFLSKKIKTEQYYPNGKVEKRGMAKVVVDAEYINYFWTGNWKCYDEAGNFVRIETYVNGELVERK